MADWPQVVGAAGGGITIPYVYSSRRDFAAAAGQFGFGLQSGTWTPGSVCAVPSYTDANGADWTAAIAAFLGSFGAAPYLGQLRVWRASDPSVFVEFSFDDAEDFGGTAYFLESSQAGIVDSTDDPFTDGELVYLSITLSGLAGAIGGGIALRHTWAGSVGSEADPTTGHAKAVTASDLTTATALVVSQTDRFGVDVTAILDSLNDSTNAIKGQVRLFEEGNLAHYAIYDVTGVTDHAGSPGYAEIAVTYIGGGPSGSLNFAPCAITFSPAGDAGAAGPSLVPQQSSGGPVGSAPSLIQTGTTYSVEDEFEIVTNDEVEIAAGACLAIH